MDRKEVNEIILSDEELMDATDKNKILILELCKKAATIYKKQGSGIYLEDELGISNEVAILEASNSTTFCFEPIISKHKVKRQVKIKFREKVEYIDKIVHPNIKYFLIKYKDNDNNLVGMHHVEFCPDGDMVSFVNFQYYDENLGTNKQGHFEKTYEKVFMQGILERRLTERSDSKGIEHPTVI